MPETMTAPPAAAPIAATPPASAPPPPKSASPPPAAPAKTPENPYAELDALDAEDKAPIKPKEQKKSGKPEPVRDADGKFAEPASDGSKPKEGDPGTKPVSGEKPAVHAAATGPVRTAELRTRYDEAKAKIADLEPKLQQYERELTELRTRLPDTKPLQEKISALEQENKVLLDEMRFVNYEKHPEFLNKFHKPYEEYWTKAVAEIGQLSLALEDGSTRKATANDFLALAQAPLDQLDHLAAEWFPKSAARVIRHVEKVRELYEARQKALDDARAGSGEREKQMAERRQQEDLAASAAFTESKTELEKKYPRWFSAKEGDTAGNDLLRKGYEYADSVFANGNLSPVQKVQRLAVVRAKAANHDRLVAQLKSASTRIKELETDLAAYENSAPPGGGDQPSGGGTVDFVKSANDELDSLDKK